MDAFLVKDIIPGSESSNPILLGNIDGELFFTSFDSSGLTTKLWKTDSTEAGTVVVDDFGSQSFSPTDVSNANGHIFFTLASGNISINLYKIDAVGEGALLIDSYDPRISPPSFSSVVGANNILFTVSSKGPFSSPRPALVKYDNTTFDKVTVKDDFGLSGAGGPANLTGVGDTLYFRAGGNTGEEEFDRELWKSDGTNAGTVEVKDINPGNDASDPENLTDVNGTLYFTADDGTNGRELWKSDGTSSGTVLVEDIRPGSGGSDANNLTDVNGTLFFTADDGSNGRELWKSSGKKRSDTVLVKDIVPGSDSSAPENLTNVNGKLYFTASNGSDGVELWKSNGKEKGTVLVKDIRPGSEGSSPDNLINVNGTLYFTANDGTNGTELWKSNGTESGTVLVADIRSGSEGSNPDQLTNVNGKLYFSADDGINGREVWVLDTTKQASNVTLSVADVNPNNFNNLPELPPNQATILPTMMIFSTLALRMILSTFRRVITP